MNMKDFFKGFRKLEKKTKHDPVLSLKLNSLQREVMDRTLTGSANGPMYTVNYVNYGASGGAGSAGPTSNSTNGLTTQTTGTSFTPLSPHWALVQGGIVVQRDEDVHEVPDEPKPESFWGHYEEVAKAVDDPDRTAADYGDQEKPATEEETNDAHA